MIADIYGVQESLSIYKPNYSILYNNKNFINKTKEFAFFSKTLIKTGGYYRLCKIDNIMSDYSYNIKTVLEFEKYKLSILNKLV